MRPESRTISRVSMTVFSTHCCKNPAPEPPARRWGAAALWALVLAWVCWAVALPAHAENPSGITEMRLERTEDGLYLSAALQFELPALVEDALYKGIPMYFTTEATVVYERWYWSNQLRAQAERHLRLSYQPLTRRWRLNVSPVPFSNTGLGVVLGQNYDDLDEALKAMQRIARWRVAEPAAVEPGEPYSVALRFQLDLSQLPRPFQIGALGRSGWSLSLARSQRLVVEPGTP